MRSGGTGATIAGESDCEQQFSGHDPVAIWPAMGQSRPMAICVIGQPGAQAEADPKAQGKAPRAG